MSGLANSCLWRVSIAQGVKDRETTLHLAQSLLQMKQLEVFFTSDLLNFQMCTINVFLYHPQYLTPAFSLSRKSHTSVGGCADKKVNILSCSWAQHHWETWPETHSSVCKLSVTGTQINKEAYCMWLEKRENLRNQAKASTLWILQLH